jgi:hypothetical protein
MYIKLQLKSLTGGDHLEYQAVEGRIILNSKATEYGSIELRTVGPLVASCKHDTALSCYMKDTESLE